MKRPAVCSLLPPTQGARYPATLMTRVEGGLGCFVLLLLFVRRAASITAAATSSLSPTTAPPVISSAVDDIEPFDSPAPLSFVIVCGCLSVCGLAMVVACFLCRHRGADRDGELGSKLPSKQQASAAAPFSESAAWRVAEECETGCEGERTTNPLYGMAVESTACRAPRLGTAVVGPAPTRKESAGRDGLFLSSSSTESGTMRINGTRLISANYRSGTDCVPFPTEENDVPSSKFIGRLRHAFVNPKSMAVRRVAVAPCGSLSSGGSSLDNSHNGTDKGTNKGVEKAALTTSEPLQTLNDVSALGLEKLPRPPSITSTPRSETLAPSSSNDQSVDSEPSYGNDLHDGNGRLPVSNGRPFRRSAALPASGRARGAEATGRPSTRTVAEGVAAGAEDLVATSFIPGIKEMAVVVAGLARLAAADHRGDAKEMERRVQWCRAVVLTLSRARSVLQEGSSDDTAEKQALLNDVKESILDMAEIVLCYRNKHLVSKVSLSTLCEQRRAEADAATMCAVRRLKLSLPIVKPAATPAGHTLTPITPIIPIERQGEGEDKKEWSPAMPREQEIVGKAARKRIQKSLERVDIPAIDVSVSLDEVIGMGGFGNVYIADFNGINTAAKIVNFTSVVDDSTQDQEMLDDSRLDQKSRRRAAVARAKRAAAKERTENRELAGFLRELEAIKRLRSPRTVQIFGAVTAPRDRVVLVMELLPGGDLRYRLRRSRRPLDDGTLRGIVTDICSGMAFLHGEAFVHGDLKSSNVLFDAAGRAKIADLGTSLWTYRTTHVATYEALVPGGLMSLPWAAPEVLNRLGATRKSDVYSVGIVVWECLTRKLPWVEVTDEHSLLEAVTSGARPSIPEDAPADLAQLAQACWAHDPAARPSLVESLAHLNGDHNGGGRGEVEGLETAELARSAREGVAEAES